MSAAFTGARRGRGWARAVGWLAGLLVLMLVAIAFSPLWLGAALLWLVLRRPRAPDTTMAA